MNHVGILAALVAFHRPEWKTASIANLLNKIHCEAGILSRAALEMALDENIALPSLTALQIRIDHHRSGWGSTHALLVTSSQRKVKCPEIGHETYFAENCGACRSDRLAAPGPQPGGSVENPPILPNPVAVRGAELCRAALAESRRTAVKPP